MIDTSLDTSNFYFLIAVIQGFVLSLLIFFRRPSRMLHRFLGILIFLFSLSLLHLVLEESIHAFNGRFPIPMDFGMAYGPLAYFHVLLIKNPKRKFLKKDLLHFLPSLIFDVFFFTGFFLYLGANMDWAYEHIPLIQGIGLSLALLGAIQLGVYGWLIFKESKDARILLREFTKVREWLSYIIICWITIIGFLFLSIPIALFFIDQFDDNSAYIYKPLGAIMGLCIYALGYLYITRYAKAVEAYTERAKKFTLSEEELDQKKQQILQALTGEKLYADTSLTVSGLAEHLGWPINQLSTIINESLHTNFNDLINQHRIAAFKAKVLEPESQKFSILGLAKEAGFSSKASFYRAFKKETGLTPTEFMKHQMS